MSEDAFFFDHELVLRDAWLYGSGATPGSIPGSESVLSRRVRGLWLYAIICSLWGVRGDVRTCRLRDARTKKRKTRVRTNKRKQESRRAVIGRTGRCLRRFWIP